MVAWLKAIATTGLSKAAGLNWYKWGIIAALFVAWTGYVHMRATNKCELEHERQKTEQAVQKTVEVIKEVEVRVPVVQVKEVESTKLKAEVARLKGELDEAIANNPKDSSCDLSGAELDGFNSLLEKTRQH